MSRIILIIALSAASLLLHAQKLDCKHLKEGVFGLKENSVYTIERNKTKQIEKDIKSGIISEFDIKWVNNCTYLLYNRKVVKGLDKTPPHLAKDTLYNEILWISGNTHRVRSQIKRLKFVTETDITIINSK